MTGSTVAGAATGGGSGGPAGPPERRGGNAHGENGSQGEGSRQSADVLPPAPEHPDPRSGEEPLPPRTATESLPRPALPTRLKERLRTTLPLRLRLLRAAVITVAVATCSLLLLGGIGASGVWDRIDHRSAPRVTRADDLYFALNDMDAQAANLLLSSGGRGLAPMPAQHAAAQQRYTASRHAISTDVLTLGSAAQGDGQAMATVVAFSDDFSRYQELIGRALENDVHPDQKANALTDYRAATDLLRQSLLPAASRLGQTNDGAYEATYRAARSDITTTSVLLLVTGGGLLAVLLLLQVHLARRFRRSLNPGLIAATACAVAACALGWSVLDSQQHQLKVARRDAFDSVVALSQARAMSYDVNADESRYLLDPDRRGLYEQAFQDTSQRLLTLPGSTLGSYDADLATALAAYRANPADPRFTGYYGDEFRNITFAGERAAAERTVRSYAVYERDDRTFRAMVRQGRLQQAVEFCIGYGKDASNTHFEQYDEQLVRLIGINQRAYTGAVAAGRNTVTDRLPGAGAALLAVIGCTLLGLRPRLREFR